MTSPFAHTLDCDNELRGLYTTDSDDALLFTLAFADEFQLSFSTPDSVVTTPLPQQSQEQLLSPELASRELLTQVLDVEVGHQLQQRTGDDGATAVSQSTHLTITETDDSLVEQVLIQTGVAELLQYANTTTDAWYSGQDLQQQQQQPADPGGLFAPIEGTSKNNSHKKKTTSKQQQQQKSQLVKTCGGGARRAVSMRHASNKARDERKEELIYLRRRVLELEQQLANKSKLRQQQVTSSSSLLETAAERSITREPPGTCSNLPASKTTSVWQEIVSRQYNQRVRAERENIRLKLVLENQLKIAKSLEKVLQKTTSSKDFKNLIHGMEPSYSSFTSPPQASDDPSGARRLFEELLAGMDQSYAEAESIFEANGVAHMETSTINAAIRSDESVGIELEVFGNKVLPFDMRAAGSVVWHHYAFAKDRIPNRVYHHNSPQTLNATEDTILEDFNLELDVNSATALFHAKQVVRRYTEENRIVIVWRTFFDPLHIANEPTPGVRFLERGYIVIKQSRSAAGTVSNVLQTCYISTPVMTGDLADAHSATLRKIIDFVLGATSANISSSHEMIENVLLEHAIKAQYVK